MKLLELFFIFIHFILSTKLIDVSKFKLDLSGNPYDENPEAKKISSLNDV